MFKFYQKASFVVVAAILTFMLSVDSVIARPYDEYERYTPEQRTVLNLKPKSSAKDFSSTWTQSGNASDLTGSVQCSESDTKTGKSDLQLTITAVSESGKSVGGKPVKVNCHKGWQRDNYSAFAVDGLKLKNGKKYKLSFQVNNPTKYGKTAYLYYIVKPAVGSQPEKQGLPEKCKTISGDRYAFPGSECFQLGQTSPYVKVLDELLIKTGAKGIVKGPRYTQTEVNAVRAFQLAHSSLSGMPDGYPGVKTWNLLVAEAMKKSSSSSKKKEKVEKKPSKTSSLPKKCEKLVYIGLAPKFPGAECFVLGQKSPYVTKLGEMLTKAGYGKGKKGFYKVGPTPTFTEVDRLSLQRFQAEHRELAGDADGYPGPLTWKLLVKEAGLSK